MTPTPNSFHTGCTSHPLGNYSPVNIIELGGHAGHEFLIAHNDIGYRCGYVRVPEGHPWHGKDYDSIKPSPEVHGGLTYAERGSDGSWWVGFDCAHCFDNRLSGT